MAELLTSAPGATAAVPNAAPPPTAPVTSGAAGATTANAAPNLSDLLTAAGADPEIIKAPTLAKFTGLKDLAKSYVELERHLGQKGLPLPAKTVDEDPDAWAGVWDALGRPKAAGEYVYPDGAGDVDASLLEMLKATSFAEGLTQRQSAKLFEGYQNWAKQQLAASEAADKARREKAVETLRTEWGGAFDERLAAAKALVSEFGGPELMTLYEQIGLNDHPGHLKLLANAAQFLRGERLVGKSIGLSTMSTPSEARAELAKLESDATVRKALFDENDPRHRELRERRTALYKAAYPA